MTPHSGTFELGLDQASERLTALQAAGAIALALERRYHRALWPGWPEGWCVHACVALAPVIRIKLGWDVRLAFAAVEGYAQTVILTPDNDLIDPTYGQHDGGPALRVLPAGQTDRLGHYLVPGRIALSREAGLRCDLGVRVLDYARLLDQSLAAIVASIHDTLPAVTA